MTTGQTIALIMWPFFSKVMSLRFNMLSRFVTAFFPRSKCLLTLWLQSPSTVILEFKKIKSDTVSPSIFHDVIGPDAMIFVLIQVYVNQVSQKTVSFWIVMVYPSFVSLIHSTFSNSYIHSIHYG